MRRLTLLVVLLPFLAIGLSAPPSLPQAQAEKKDNDKADAPYVKLPATKTVKPNRYFCIRPDTNCPSVKWIIPSGLDRLDPEIPIKDTNAAVLIGDTGTYTVQAYGALGDQASDIATCTVTIGSPAPPPGPPTPPNPPVPDALTQTLQAAYAQDTDANKAEEAKTLAQLYATAASTTVNDTTLTTLADLFNTLKKASASLLPTTAIPKLRGAVATYLSGQLGTNAQQSLDAATRAKARTAFSALAQALGGLK